MTAATIQQGLVSAIVELLIASGLALPKLLRSRRAAEPIETHQGRDQEARAPALAIEVLPPTTLDSTPRALPKRSVVQEPIDERAFDPKPVIAFLTQHVPIARGSRADWGEIYGGFREWQTKLGQEVWPAAQFGAVLRHICEQANIRVIEVLTALGGARSAPSVPSASRNRAGGWFGT
jgi:hypothetical protein